MPKQTLSPTEIEELFIFTKSKYVRFKDVQYEIVDHLASAIEDEIENNPSLSFHSALDLVYSRFPITGFWKFISDRQEGLASYWRKKILKIYIEYIKMPKVIFTGALLIAIINLVSLYSFGTSIIIISTILYSIYGTYRFFDLMKIKTSDGVKVPWQWNSNFDFNTKDEYLFLSSFRDVSGVNNAVGFLAYIMSRDSLQYNSALDNPFQIVFVSVVFTMLLLYTHATIHYYPQIIKDEIQNKYKHLGLQMV
jgi:hypothetical protein